jgi:superfamily II DNA helicase RecQ
MCLGESGFTTLLKEPRWSRSILFMVIDEAHCIKQWGAEFRKHYSTLETLRSFVPRGVPVLATSATMPPDTLTRVRVVLGMTVEKTFHLNLGNDRHNIVPLVWPMDGGAVNLAALDFVVCGRDQPLRTIIYFNDKCLVVIVDHQQGLETDSGGSDDFDSASDPEGSDDEHDRDNSGLQDIP